MKRISALAAGFILLSSQVFAQAYDYEIRAGKIDAPRSQFSSKSGSSSYKFDASDIENLPQGQMTSLNQILARAPSVVQNAQNKIYVRGDHGNLQYRINDVMLPDAVSNFGQIIDAHFVKEMSLHTGAMNAEFGFRNAGVLDIKTKGGSEKIQQRGEVMAGSYDTLAANYQLSGSRKLQNFAQKFEYFLSGTYQQNSRGIESTSSAYNQQHNDTSQNNLFAHLSYVIEANKKLDIIAFDSTNRYEIPVVAGQPAEFTRGNLIQRVSQDRNQKQFESNRFAVAALKGITDQEIDYQVSVFASESISKVRPDVDNDLIFTGLSTDIDQNSKNLGIQADASYELNSKNTLKAGLYVNHNKLNHEINYFAFPVDGNGDQTSNNPLQINQDVADTSQLYGVYLQNEWKASSQLTVNYGARFDIAQTTDSESQLSPRVKAIYNLDKKTTLHAGYSRFFTPASNALASRTNPAVFANTSAQAEVVANSPVKAERSNYFDFGIAHKLNRNVNLALDLYYKQSRNMIDQHQVGETLLTVPFNYAEGKTYGAEFKAEYVKNNLSAYFNLGLQRAYGKRINSAQYIHEQDEINHINSNEIALDHVQNYTASIGATYNYLSTIFGLDALYGSGLRTGSNNHNTMPSYWQVNGSVAHAFVFPYLGKTNLKLSAVNLFDDNYQYSDGSGVGISAAQFAPRRSFFLIASKNF
jgi:hypothetical protein